MRLSRLIVLLVFAVAAIPATLILGVTSLSTRRVLLANARELVRERADRLRLRLADQLSSTERAVELAARRPSWPTLPGDERLRILSALLAQREEIDVATLFDPAGHPLPGMQQVEPGLSPVLLERHLEAASSLLPDLAKSAWSNVHRFEGQRPAVTLVVPIPDRLARAHSASPPPAGFLAAELDLEGIGELVARQPLGNRTQLIVADGLGLPIAARGPFSEKLNGPDGDRLRRALIEGRRSTDADVQLGTFELPGGGLAIGATALVPGTGWEVAVLTPSSDATGLVGRVQREGAVALFIGLAIAALLGLLFARRVVGPLRQCVAQALDVSRGRFGGEMKIRRRDELGDLAHTFNYMSKQLHAFDQETRGLYQSLEKGYLETMVALANGIDSKDPYTRGHSQRVADLSVATGAELGLPERTQKHLLYGGILHDIGKIGIPERILGKQAVLTEEEMKVMREHPIIGATIVGPVGFLGPALPCVRNHHERWDGTGYPDRLKSTDIPLVARVVNVADTWDACTSTRPYQDAMSFDEARAVLERLSGSQCDPDVVKACLRALDLWRSQGRPVVASQPRSVRAASGA
ncbi:MAG: HD domain-containing phosphohydrolase [Deltaproteobacteria bacterium]